ncbi:TatD family hydrolase [Vibrio aphrogenes]|uniref:TatD family hydrolase n=1 Tax=Vibrio aphrogenes TaxID=1891186 RepID=UPI000B34E841|nr:TatD family hydrolase [Vibrio aphrogenes]
MPEYSFIDSHCHFDFPAFSDTQSELLKAHQAGVKRIVIPAVGLSNWPLIQALSQQYPALYYSLGFHPYFIDQHPEDASQQLEAALRQRDSKCVAIGECGLDFMLNQERLTQEMIDKQYELLDCQLQLATQYQLPVIIHARKAHDKVLARLKRYRLKKGGVIHAFSGSKQQAMEYVKLGFYIGVGGVITYSRAKKTRQAIAQLPLESLLLETDAPDMPVSGFQGQPNHPERLIEIFNALCSLRKENKAVIERQIWKNNGVLFGWNL